MPIPQAICTTPEIRARWVDSIDVLTERGVDYGKGYFLGRPQPLVQHLTA